MGPWLRSERHVQYKMIRDQGACFVCSDEAWTRYRWNSTKKVFEKEGITKVDTRKCHPVEGRIENHMVYTHFKFNITEDHEQTNPNRTEVVTINEVEPQEVGTHIYSDGSSHMEQRQGACAAIVNKGGKHFVGTRSLLKDQGKNSYCAELEGVFLGSQIAGEGGNKDKRWDFWTDSKAAIVQCEKNS